MFLMGRGRGEGKKKRRKGKTEAKRGDRGEK
jgi:hypothetical protein